MRRPSLAALVVVTLLTVATPARAADTTINFSELGLPQYTTILDQYAAAPYQVRFGNPTRFGFPAPPDNLNCSNPYLQDGALNGTALGIACATGPSEFPDRRFATAMEFANEKRKITFNIVNRTPSTQTAITKFYAIGGTLLTTLTTPLYPNAIQQVSYDRGSNGIIGAVIAGQQAMGWGDSGGVFIDDLVQTQDATALTPKYTLALQQPSTEVVEGAGVDVPVSVRRYNGSAGPVTLSVGALPAKIASTQFLPNAAPAGSDPATLRITAKDYFTGTVQLAISASGGGAAGTGVNVTGLQQSVTGIPAAYFSTGGRFPIRLVPGCGPQKIDDYFGIRGGFSGYTDYNFAGTTGTSGLRSMTTGGSLFPSGDGQYPISYTLDPGDGDGSGTFKVQVQPLGETPVQLTLNWISDRLAIDGVADRSPQLPLADGGSTVAIVGNFPLGCPVSFKDPAGQTWPVTRRDTTTDDSGRQRDVYVLGLPATATSGPLTAVNAAGTTVGTTQPIDVREFRRSFALAQVNGGAGAKGTYSWADFERTFGSDDTDACFIVCVHDPIASDYYDQFKSKVQSGSGLCYGYAVMAARFRGYGTGQRPSDYQPGAGRAWEIAPVSDGTAVKRDVVRWYVTQFDKNMQKLQDQAAARSAADERTLVRDLIAQQGAALVTFRQGSSGHAVTAYGYQDLPGGGIKLAIYDPNLPYTAAEQTSKVARTDALTRGSLTIAADGSWSGSSLGWKGDNASLRVIANIPPLDAKLPNDFSLTSVFGSSGGTPPATITQIETGGRPQLDSGGAPNPGSPVGLVTSDSGVAADASYRLAHGRQYELTIKGTGKGAYDSSSLAGGGNASVRGVRTGKGQVDHLTLSPGEASLRFAGAGKGTVLYDLKAKDGRTIRTAAIAISGGGGTDEAALSGATVRLSHSGAPATARITLGSAGGALPSGATTAPITIGRGQRLELRPLSWTKLEGGARFTVRARDGRVVRRGVVRTRPTGSVALGAVSAKRSGRRVTVSGRVIERGASPVLAAIVTVKKGGRAIRHKTVTRRDGSVRKGRFSLPVTVGAVPSGARVTVTVLLADPSGGAVRKQIAVRR